MLTRAVCQSAAMRQQEGAVSWCRKWETRRRKRESTASPCHWPDSLSLVAAVNACAICTRSLVPSLPDKTALNAPVGITLHSDSTRNDCAPRLLGRLMPLLTAFRRSDVHALSAWPIGSHGARSDVVRRCAGRYSAAHRCHGIRRQCGAGRTDGSGRSAPRPGCLEERG